MTKKELVDQIAEKRGMSAQEVLSVVEDLMKLVKRNVAAGDSVYLRGFGVFQSRLRRAKVGRNITKGEQLSIPAKRVPQFRPYPHFKKTCRKERLMPWPCYARQGVLTPRAHGSTRT